MPKLPIIISVFLLNILMTGAAQTQPNNYTLQVNYKMTYSPDSTFMEHSISERVSLFIGDEMSLYCATQYPVMDSAIYSEHRKGNTYGASMVFLKQYGTKYTTLVFKYNDKITTYDKLSNFIPTPYFYDEKKNTFNWEILSDTMLIADRICQKAQMNFGNRKWIAWFTPEIPISDGPYKFCGLPGLIMKINDSQNYWNFTISSIKNIDSIIENHFSNLIPQPIKSKKEFLKQRRFSIDNRYEIMASEGAVFQTPEITKRQWEEEAKADNNWIELYK